MEGSAEDLGAPESWEVADLDESMNRLNLMLSSSKDSNHPHQRLSDDEVPPPPPPPPLPSASGDKVSDDVVNQVDQFLREAIQNPRERLSILRMEQDVENFIRDPTQQQLEFKQLPTSYLRLAAHRVAQHYSLQSMVLLDNSLPDGSGSRIIVRKTSECRLPVIRLADIPVKLSSENSAVMKVAIKQRPQKGTQILSNANSNSMKNSNSKSVEERKEEYNRARARIFSSSNNGGTLAGKPECESRQQDNSLHVSLGVPRVEDKSASVSDVTSGRGLVESSTNTNRARSRTEKEPVGRYRQNNRVAIFRDREVDRKDPDYDRSYDSRYMQRFDPGFGFNGGSYAIQPMYTAVLNYNTEFPQLGSSHRPQLSAEHQPRPLPQHIPGPWAAQSAPAGLGYGHPETMMPPFNPNQVGAHSSSTMYLHSSQYPCQRPGMPFIHHEHVHQPFAQGCFLHLPPVRECVSCRQLNFLRSF
ncbi:R3H domain-containing protein 2-like isoform X1 [Vigna unguiculata]|uniref:R3H domain-containing protein 2-like isoform X1 n=1 Tax=Vigna unguiculata TaxID=3917 RepID=UPI001015E9B4|nr:R3H domain-containing protein 2-like isoform X1 [Vigna unguiculata]